MDKGKEVISFLIFELTFNGIRYIYILCTYLIINLYIFAALTRIDCNVIHT